MYKERKHRLFLYLSKEEETENGQEEKGKKQVCKNEGGRSIERQDLATPHLRRLKGEGGKEPKEGE